MPVPSYCEVQYEFQTSSMRKRPVIANPVKAYSFLFPYWYHISIVQTFKLLLMDYQCLPLSLLSFSGREIEASSGDVKPLLAYAEELRARFLILAHNSPSGSLDLNVVTLINLVLQDAEQYGLVVKDHLFVTPRGFYSMYAMGHLKKAYLK